MSSLVAVRVATQAAQSIQPQAAVLPGSADNPVTQPTPRLRFAKACMLLGALLVEALLYIGYVWMQQKGWLNDVIFSSEVLFIQLGIVLVITGFAAGIILSTIFWLPLLSRADLFNPQLINKAGSFLSLKASFCCAIFASTTFVIYRIPSAHTI